MDNASQQDPAVARTRNLPPFQKKDLLGLVVAIVGTLILVVLAATCDSGPGAEIEHGGGTSAECTARILIAVGVALINAAHIVGLFLFESVGYRGFFARMFAMLSLIGTPIAIVVSLLIH